MQYLYEKVAYLKGLAEGLGIDENSKEGKLLMHIVDVLEDFADAIVEIEEEQSEMAEYIESIDEDLEDLEEEVYEEDSEDEEFEYIEVQCPSCGEEVEIDEDLLYDDDVDILCPNCKEVILFAEEDCHCHGDHEHDNCHCGNHEE
ncbi:CD1247 N-terminal domain-containing protein [Tepidibacter formicigenes]|jgi:phage FluMu protein Com|uniref:MJ0042 family finger-like domain-containing protein n=1 Tax=Tepidibacter formicigenes DSM 15518 TaxID=1123349 RepID=A0A1M6PWE2_9FIRM|nr:CD1247 N-terminal domain-containing protein [Tepidibacter formicigenes]SHK12313.1 hypothetical protein SAMN02744037_01678 [Tepidibacter formicigenes DSM 15518]